MGSEAQKEKESGGKVPNSSGRAVPREATWRVKKPDIPRDSGFSHSNADMVTQLAHSGNLDKLKKMNCLLNSSPASPSQLATRHQRPLSKETSTP